MNDEEDYSPDRTRLQIRVTESLAVRIAELSGCLQRSQSAVAAMFIESAVGRPHRWLRQIEETFDYLLDTDAWTEYTYEKPGPYVQAFVDARSAARLDVIADVLNTTAARLATVLLGVVAYDEEWLVELNEADVSEQSGLLEAYLRKEAKRRKTN